MMVLVGRKLLYHRGIDDQIGTYITDYIQASLCITFALYLMMKQWSIGKGEDYKNETKNKSTIAVIIILFSISMSAFFGGLTHQFLQTVEPYKSVNDGWVWLFLWRLASAFSAPFCFGSVLLAQQILVQEGVEMGNKTLKIFYGSLTFSCFALFAYCFLMLLKEDDPWSLSHTFITVYIFVIIEAAMLLYATCIKKRDCEEPICEYTIVDNDQHGDFSLVHQKGRCCEQEITSTSDVHSLKKETHFKISLILHLFASLFFLASGVTQRILAKYGCDVSDDHDHDEVNKCPLPRSFNHNALLHIMTTSALFLSFLAELLSIRARRRLGKAEQDKCVNSNSSYCTESSV